MTNAPSPITAKPSSRFSVTFIRALAATIDLLSIGITGLSAHILCVRLSLSDAGSRYVIATLLGLLISASVFYLLDVYNLESFSSSRVQFLRVIKGWILTFCILLLIGLLLENTVAYSFEWAIAWFLSAIIALAITRVGMNSRFAERTIIVGAGEHGQKLAQQLGRRSNWAMRVVGVVDDRTTRIPASVHDHRVLGNVDHLIRMIRDNFVDGVIIALPRTAEQRLKELVSRLAVTPVRVYVTPGLVETDYTCGRLVLRGGVPMLQVLERPISGWMYVAKSLEDGFLAAAMLVILSPLLLGIWTAIKLDSPGPAIFRQARYGFNNTVFQVLKFRTMHANMTDPTGQLQTARNDMRVTRVGRWLRLFSLDELPQFLNVLRGEMSIVGPRAHSVSMIAQGKPVDAVVNRYAARHRVKPGITGWAQVNGLRGELSTIKEAEERTNYDLYYVENWSIWLDLLIIFRTPGVILRGAKAH